MSKTVSMAGILCAFITMTACSAHNGAAEQTPLPQPDSATAFSLSTSLLNGELGFINADGMTTYVFDGDISQAGVSTCVNACSSLWPPLAPPQNATLASPWASFTRSDGLPQLAYKTRPLYTYANDPAPGYTLGNDINSFGNAWHIATP